MLAVDDRPGNSTILCFDQAFRGFAVSFFTDTSLIGSNLQ